MQQHDIVSCESENLILVDADDRPIGELSKGEAHNGEGVLHRAFSLFVFNAAGELLLQQRSADKRLWGGYWSNSCCSHPRVGETNEVAIHRRLAEELGLRAELKFVYKFQYQAHFGELGSEHELCHVYVGCSDEEPQPNDNEVMAWRWIDPEQLDRELDEHPERFTPWFKMEWAALRGQYAHVLQAHLRQCA